MQPLRNSEFWEDTINEASRRAAKQQVRLHYRPVGLLVVLSFLVLVVLLDHGVPVPMAILVTMLVALLTIVFS